MNFAIVFLISFHLTSASSDQNWWKHTTIYQIFVASFKDSNGDGIGNLKGITSKLDHFVDLGIDCLYLTPFFKSDQKYAGYDITNYTEIESTYGTMRDFDQLMREMKRRRMKLIIDLVINHSGIGHEWFKKSQQRIGKYTDYYIWADAKGYDKHGQPIPPSNWANIIFGTSMWTWNDERKQFYLHQFTPEQPDLNLRSDAVKTEIKQIIKFWIDKGVSGTRLDAAIHFVEDAQFRDEPLANPNKTKIERYDDLIHTRTANQPETYQVLHEIRTFTDDYTRHSNKRDCIYLAECTTTTEQQLRDYFGKPDYPVVHFPYNFKLAKPSYWYNAKTFDDVIMSWIGVIPEWATSNWMIENQDLVRVTNRYCEEYSYMLTMATMTLPGIAIIYYGQEIAISGFSAPDVIYDRAERLPMHWDDSSNAGFTTNHQAWVPINSNYWRVNVAAQKSQKSSPYQVFKKLIRLRKTKTLKYGHLKTYIVTTWVYAFVRSYSSHQTFITVLNFSTNEEIVDLHQSIEHLPKHLRVAVASVNAGYETGDVISSAQKFPAVFPMRPLSSLVLTTKLK